MGLAQLILFEQGKADGELPDCDPRALAQFYIAVLQGMSVQAIDGASVKPDDDRFDLFRD